MSQYRVEFLPFGKSATIGQDETILDAARKAGVCINSVCGGDGACGKCKVFVREGKIAGGINGRISEEDIARGLVLACLAVPLSDLLVEVPPESMGGKAEAPELVEGAVEEQEPEQAPNVPVDPVANETTVELEPPTLESNIPDAERLRVAFKDSEPPVLSLRLLRKLPSLLREEKKWIGQYKVRYSTWENRRRLQDVTPASDQRPLLGLAVDIGTTTLATRLHDLHTGEIVAKDGCYNSQTTYGADVISRIVHCRKEDGLEQLRSLVLQDIHRLLGHMCRRVGAKSRDVAAAVITGNTTMAHLFLGVEPTYIRLEPYVPAAACFGAFTASEVGLRIHPDAFVFVAPAVAGFVGGDIVCGVVATGMNKSELPSLLVDIGTNGEVVLGNKDWLMCCSASAGPAFEGSGIRDGMRAARGAIERVSFDGSSDRPELSIIGNTKPMGICGSALIDLLAGLFRRGIVDGAGRLQPGTSDALRIVEGDPDNSEYILVPAQETAVGRDIGITESDIMNLVRSKGAIYAAIRILMENAGMTFDDVEKFRIAGGFGRHIDPRNAITIGLIPDLPPEKVEFVGNSALQGASMALLNKGALEEMREVARNLTYIELSTYPTFMDEFTMACFLPHTNVSEFPSVVGATGKKL